MTPRPLCPVTGSSATDGGAFTVTSIPTPTPTPTPHRRPPRRRHQHRRRYPHPHRRRSRPRHQHHPNPDTNTTSTPTPIRPRRGLAAQLQHRQVDVPPRPRRRVQPQPEHRITPPRLLLSKGSIPPPAPPPLPTPPPFIVGPGPTESGGGPPEGGAACSGGYGRRPTQGELAAYTSQLAAGADGTSIQIDLLASKEYYADAGSRPLGFVIRLYDDVLRRDPTPIEVASALATLASGDGAERSELAQEIVLGPEARAIRVDNAFHTLLNRYPDSAELASGSIACPAPVPPPAPLEQRWWRHSPVRPSSTRLREIHRPASSEVVLGPV